jgi:hypothetical protein
VERTQSYPLVLNVGVHQLPAGSIPCTTNFQLIRLIPVDATGHGACLSEQQPIGPEQRSDERRSGGSDVGWQLWCIAV